jgi:hypothetical protein
MVASAPRFLQMVSYSTQKLFTFDLAIEIWCDNLLPRLSKIWYRNTGKKEFYFISSISNQVPRLVIDVQQLLSGMEQLVAKRKIF